MKSGKNIAVIGGGLGGMSAALHLKKAGFNTTIFESNDRLGGRANLIQQDGFSFDTGPSLLNYPWIFKEILEISGKKLEDYLELIPVDPSITFFWPDQTNFTLSSDIYKLKNEMERIDNQSSNNLFSFLSESEHKFKISFDYLVSKNANNYFQWLRGVKISDLIKLRLHSSFYNELNRHFKNRYICEALGSYSMYLGGSPFSLPGIFTILPYGELSRGLFFPRGGMYSIVRGIKSLLDELNINIRLNTPIKYISVKNSKVVGIELANGNILNFDLVVSNADVPTTYEKLLQIDERSKEKYLKQFNNKMTPGVFTFYLGIEGKVGNLPHHSIFLPNDYKKTFENLLTYGKLPNELPFYISIPSETDPSLAPESHSAVFILVPVPTISKLNITDYNKQSKEILSKVFERLRQHGIKIQKESIVLQKQLTPLDWQSKFYLYDGSAFGLSHTLFKMGPGRPKNFDTKIRGLYFVGGSTTPGTGVPMVLLSGKMTAERILSDV